MLRRNKEDREADRVLVVADLENGWESIIGWAISRSQQGDSIFILNVISTVNHAERINRDAGGDAKDGSESADEEERLLRARLKLLSDTLKTLSKSVVGVKVCHVSTLPHKLEGLVALIPALPPHTCIDPVGSQHRETRHREERGVLTMVASCRCCR